MSEVKVYQGQPWTEEQLAEARRRAAEEKANGWKADRLERERDRQPNPLETPFRGIYEGFLEEEGLNGVLVEGAPPQAGGEA